MTRRPLVVIGPLPPPYHGVTVSTGLVLANERLRERFDVRHLDTSDRRGAGNIGTWDLTNLVLGFRNAATLLRLLRGPRGVVYLPLSQSVPAYLRDSLFVLIARAAGWRVAGHLRGSEFRELYRRQPRPVRAWMRLTLRRLDSLAVMGDSLRGLFDGLLPRERIVVVPNGTPDVSPNGRADSGDTVLFLSNLRRRKGVVESVEAALKVVARRPGTTFLFVGSVYDEDLDRELRALAAPVGDRIRFLPPATGDEKRTLLLSSSVLLFPPAEPEGHPRVVLEAMSAGLAVVTTDRGAIAETVADGVTGYVLPDPDPDELADRLLRLLDDDELRGRMQRASRRRYLDLFTQDRADRLLADWLADVAMSSR